MQFDAAGTLKAPVRWYFCKPGAKPFDYPHLYVSSNWLTVPQQAVGPGESAEAVRSYDKGVAPAGASGQGTPCGPADWWQNGVPSDAPRLQLGPSGLAGCCSGTLAAGGLFVGGGRVVPCVPLVSGDVVAVETSLNPGFVTTSEVVADHWNLDYPNGINIQVLGSGAFGGTPPCVFVISEDNAAFPQLKRNPAFISYESATKTLTFVDPPGLPTSRLDNLVVRIRIVNRIFAVTGGVLAGGSAAINRIWKAGTGGVLAGGSADLGLVVSGEGGLRVGGSSATRIPATGTGGVLAGGSAALGLVVSGEGGLETGGSADLDVVVSGEGGLETGGSADLGLVVSGDGGAKLGGSYAERLRRTGNGGAKLGGSYVRTLHATGSGGLKAGGGSNLKLRRVGNGGVKAGGTSTATQGLLLLCCPGQLFPLTIFGQSGGGTKFSMAWDNTNHWYQGSANTPTETVRLACTFTAGVWKWVMSAVVQFGCSYSYTQTSLSCGPPFSLVITQHATGGSCVIFGNWVFTFTTT